MKTRSRMSHPVRDRSQEAVMKGTYTACPALEPDGVDHVSILQAGTPVCPVCGGDRYYLVLRAEALTNRGGLSISCSHCHAARPLFDGPIDAL